MANDIWICPLCGPSANGHKFEPQAPEVESTWETAAKSWMQRAEKAEKERDAALTTIEAWKKEEYYWQYDNDQLKAELDELRKRTPPEETAPESK